VGNNYIVTTPNSIKWQSLHSASYSFDSSFELLLADNSILYANKVLRVLPKKRIVVAGHWQDKLVVAKLFLDSKQAKRHAEKDAVGISILQKNRIPTSIIYYQGLNADKSIHVLLLEKITDAKNLQEYLQDLSQPERLHCLERVIVELATQHVLGVLQKDLHFNNILLNDSMVFTLDGGQIKQYSYLLSKKISMENLALFLSQLGVGFDAEQLHLFQYYAKVRGWLLKPNDSDEMFFMIKQCNEKRWLNFEKKINRNCSGFHRIEKKGVSGVLNRKYSGNELLPYLSHPENLFHHPSAVILKSGRSSTIIKVVLDNKIFVVKRYNIKNIFHWLRRLFRETRAKKTWRLAQQLQFFGVATAKVAAYIEKRWLKFHGTSYVIMEHTDGMHLSDFCLQNNQASEKLTMVISKVVKLLKNLAKLNITHGDLKATNILLDQQLSPVLIDLDGATLHLSLDSMHAAWKKDMHRFLKNFKNHPEMIEMIKSSW
jgi:tRNA A-37 threonylcarbamoyl transferase component Bud32